MTKTFRFRYGAILLCAAALLGAGFAATDGRLRLLAFNTLLLGLGAAAISLPVGSFLGLLIARTDIWGKRLATACLVLLLFTPMYLVAAGWEAGLGRQGWASVSVGQMAIPFLDHWRGAIWIHAMAAIPWAALFVGVASRSVISQHEEQALLEASPWRVMRTITLRGVLPAIGAAFMVVLLTAATEMTASDLYRIRTYAEEAYQGFPLGEEATVTLMTLAPVIGFLVSAASLSAGAIGYLTTVDIADATRSPIRFSLGGWKLPLSFAAFITVALLLGFPVANLVIKAGIIAQPTNTGIERSWSLVQVATLVGRSPATFSAEFFWSGAIGLVAAVCSVLLAAPLAWFASRWRIAAGLLLVVASLLLALPGPIVGSLVMSLFQITDAPLIVFLYDATILPAVLAVMTKCLPLAMLIGWFGFRTISPVWVETAALDGAGFWRQFFSIAVPNRWRSLLLAATASFAVAFGDLTCTIQLLPPGIDTLPRRMFGLLHAGADDRASALAIFNLLIFALLAALAILMFPATSRRNTVNSINIE